MYAEFEEKTYEFYMNSELGDEFCIYPPGQSEEGIIGIDAAMFSSNPKLWKLGFKIPIPSGDVLKPELWDLDEKILKSRKFPRFKCNIFVQYKRPEYISSSNGKEYPFWKKPYYRYRINNKQQKILCNLERNISNNSIVVYACPAFWKIYDLNDFYGKSELINNSNFVQPRNLRGHQIYTFINSGKYGMAFSEPFDVKTLDIIKTINHKLETAERFRNNVDFIYSLDESIMRAVNEFDDDYKKAFSIVSKKIKISNGELAEKFKHVLAFTIVTNTSWLIGIKYQFTKI